MRPNANGASCLASYEPLPDLMGTQSQIPQMPEARFIIGNWPAECAQRRSQYFDAVEIPAHVVQHAMQFTSHPLDGCFVFQYRFLR